jgi:3-methyladenine DNA glycosylase AlkD
MSKPPVAARTWADDLEAELRTVTTLGRAEHDQAYLKSDLDFIRVCVPDLRKAVRAHLAAIEVFAARSRLVGTGDLPLIERMLRESGTWALVDGLAVKMVGTLRERDPRVEATFERWARDDDVWMRRSALLAHLGELRRGDGDFETFSRYADAMLEEREFFIRKAIGWVLRET